MHEMDNFKTFSKCHINRKIAETLRTYKVYTNVYHRAIVYSKIEYAIYVGG
jgi:hypothetical protein